MKLQKAIVADAQRNTSPDNLDNGLARLVLILLETLRQLMERQARRRMREGSLTREQVERLGLAFMQLDAKIGEISKIFNVERKDLTLRLSNLADLETTPNENMATRSDEDDGTSLVDLLDSVIARGVYLLGDLNISVADVELINVQLRLVVNAFRKKRRFPVNKVKIIGPRRNGMLLDQMP